MQGMIDFVEKDGVKTPFFKEIKPCKITDDTVICTLEELIDLLGEERALGLYSVIKGGIHAFNKEG